MLSKGLLWFSALCGLLFSLNGNAQEVARRSPHNGDFYHEAGFADSYFSWIYVGGWQGKFGSIPGFELDVTVGNQFYAACVSETTLPRRYDDCETAGVLESSAGEITFGVGSYDARDIQSGNSYYARWQFFGGSDQASPYRVGWQEVWDFVDQGYGPDSPWHMDAAASGVLMSSLVSKAGWQLREWKWRDRSLFGTGLYSQEPDGRYYYTGKTQRHVGTLKSPHGANFDLSLYMWNGSAWTLVASGIESQADASSPVIETVSFMGGPGYYTWAVQSRFGSGQYQFGMEFSP